MPSTRYRVQLPPPERGPEDVPWEETLPGMIFGALVFLSLLVGIPFLLWLVAS